MGKVCSVTGCGKEHYAKGYCVNHYRMYVWYPRQKVAMAEAKEDCCSVPGCKHRSFMGGFCIKHYHRKYYVAKTHICAIPGCGRHIKNKFQYCAEHQYRIDNGKPMFGKLIRYGADNPRWAGGASYFPQHQLLKKNRRFVLEQCPLCSCGEKAQVVVHINGDKSDHRIDNLRPLCYACNGVRHRGRSNLSPLRVYGMTFSDICRALKKTYTWVRNRHFDGTLSAIIKAEGVHVSWSVKDGKAVCKCLCLNKDVIHECV